MTLKKSRDLLFFAATVLITGVLILGLCKIFLQFSLSAGDDVITKEFDGDLGWRLKPGSYAIKAPLSFTKVKLYHNPYGLRSKAPDFIPSKTAKRIIVLGDSYTYAKRFPFEQTFTSLLEKELNARDGKEVEVLNAGVPGFGTAQELLLKRRLRKVYGLKAGVYVLAVFTNDILDNLCLSYGQQQKELIRPCYKLDSAGKLFLENKPINAPYAFSDTLRPIEQKGKKKGLLKIFKQQLQQYIQPFFQTRPDLVRWLVRHGLKISLPRKPGILNGWYEDPILAEGGPLTKALMETLRDEVRGEGAELLVMMIPSPFQIYTEAYKPILETAGVAPAAVKAWEDDVLRPQKTVEKMCGELGLKFLDLYPLFPSTKANWFIPGDGHFTAAAHRVVAQALADFLENPAPTAPQVLPQ